MSESRKWIALKLRSKTRWNLGSLNVYVIVYCTIFANFHEQKSSTAAYSPSYSVAFHKNTNCVGQKMRSLISFVFQPPGKNTLKGSP